MDQAPKINANHEAGDNCNGLGIDVSKAKKDLAAQGIGLPPHAYTSQEVFDYEIQHLFGRSWVCFAPLEQLAKPGSVIRGQVGKVPIIVTRDKDGILHGFVNACRHRGYTVVEEDKTNCRALTCRYHSWSYDLNGNLRSAPDSASDFNKGTSGLLPISVETWAQFIFVNPDPNAEPLSKACDGLNRIADKFGFDKSATKYQFVEATESKQQANWKLWLENATECYHCPTIHASTFGAGFNLDQDSIKFENAKTVTATCYTPSSDDPSLKPATAIHLFPGCHMVQETGMMTMSRIIPRSPDVTTVLAYYFAEEGADIDQVKKTIGVWKQTYEEDFEVVKHQQTTLRSGHTQPFQYIPYREYQVIQHVENMMDAYSQ